MKFKAEVRIGLKPGVLDAEGKTVQKQLKLLGYDVDEVKTIKFYELIMNSESLETAKDEVEDACRRLLANPVIQNYEIKFFEVENE
ncbi:MAG: phosphoribosylformylglycinamidine synthase [Candidatus Altiarchaeales archaeon HGW-Altiarchaeales-3]|nr:MAG: phosphoribosylformylglycinamidine synthase [Candidatus Altiarchaeales archaeon HGW-Altiarchaeales-3]